MSGTNQLLICANNQNGIANGIFAVVGGGRWDTGTVSNQQITSKVATTFSKLSVHFTGGISNGTTHFQIGGASGNQVCVGSSGYVTDGTHTDSVSSSNLVSLGFTTGFATALLCTVQMNSSSPYALQGSGASPAGTGVAFSTSAQYSTIMGGGGTNAASADLNSQQATEIAGTASYLGVDITTATSGTGTVSFNKNGTAGNQAISVTASTTGVFVDTTHSDACLKGDLLALQFSSTNASGAMYSWSFSYTASSSSGMDATSSTSGSTGVTTSSFIPFGGYLTNAITEAAAQSYVPYGLTASKLRITWGSGTVTSGTLVFRNGGVTGNQTISWSGSPTLVVDSTHSDTVSATNLVNGSVTVVSGANLSSVGVTFDDGSVGANTAKPFFHAFP